MRVKSSDVSPLTTRETDSIFSPEEFASTATNIGDCVNPPNRPDRPLVPTGTSTETEKFCNEEVGLFVSTRGTLFKSLKTYPYVIRRGAITYPEPDLNEPSTFLERVEPAL